MRGKALFEDQRSVSEIYGTVLIISLAFLISLLLVGAGWVVIDQLTTETTDSLTQDSMQSVDKGIEDISSRTVNGTTTFEFPEDSGTKVSAEESEGKFKLTVVTENDTLWKRTVAEEKGLSRYGSNDTVLGTIRMEDEDGKVTAYQGGGLWRKPDPNNNATFILSEPKMDFTGQSLDLGIVNLTNVEAITEGATVRATQNAESTTAEDLERFMSNYWTDKYNPSVSAPVNISITIESKYADGWETYARESMTEQPDNIRRPDDETVVLEFEKIGSDVDLSTTPSFASDVLYAGASDFAYAQYDPSAWSPTSGTDQGEIEGNATAFEVTGPPTTNQYELALYNESGQWLIYETDDPTTSPSYVGNWTDAQGNEVNMSHTEAIEKVEDVGGGSMEYYIKPPNETGSVTPVCAVVDTGPITDITDYLDKEGEGCLKSMYQVNEDLVTPINQYPKWNVNITTPYTTGLPDTTQWVGDTFDVTVNLTNEGGAAGQIPLGVYMLNKSDWEGNGTFSNPSPYFNRSFLANGTQGSDNQLNPGESVERTYEITAERFMAGDDGQDWVVYGTTGTDTDYVNESSTTDADLVYIDKRDSNFAVENIDPSKDNPEEGEYIEVDVLVNETMEELDSPETQDVRLETPNRIVNQTDVTLDEGDDKTVTMGWRVRDGTAPTVNLTASTYDDSQEKLVNVTEVTVPEPEFDVRIVNIDEPVVAGEQMDALVEVENVGNATGDVYVELSTQGGFPDQLVDVQEVTGLAAGSSQTLNMTWQTTVGDDGDGQLVAEAGEDSFTAPAEVLAPGTTSPNFEVAITGTNSPVPGGQSVDVTAEVTNTGNATDTQFVYLENFAGDQTDFAEVSLDSGNSTTVTLSWDTEPADSGTDDVTVASDDDDDGEEVTVESPTASDSNFEVEIQSDDYGVTAGDTLSMDVEVTNTGNETDTQFVYLKDFDGNIVGTEEVTSLDPTDSTFVSLSWSTSVNDVGNGTLTVASSDDTDTASGEVFIPGSDESNFQVTIESTNSPVVESEPLNVTATIENTGDSSDTQFVVLEEFGGGPVDVKEISLTSSGGSNASVTTTFTWDTIVGDAGSGDVTVVSADDSDIAPAEITPKENEPRDPIDVVFVMDESGSMNQDACDTCTRSKGEAAVEASQNAVGSLNASKDRVGVVFFDTSSKIRKTQGQELYGNGTDDLDKVNTTIGTHNPGGGTRSDKGMADAEDILDDEDDPDRKKVVVLLSDGANDGCKSNSTAMLNDDPRDCKYDGPPSNTNSLDKTQNLVDDDVTTYAVGYGDASQDPSDVEIDVAFLQATANIGGGEYYNASNDDQLANAFDEIFDDITEPDTPTFEVAITGTNSPVESGDTLEVNVTVTNTGATDGERIVSLADFDGTNVDSETVYLAQNGSDSSKSLTLEWDTTGESPTVDDVTVQTVDDSESATVEVTEPSGSASDFVVQSVNAVNSPVEEGQTLTVNATVFNDGASDTQQVVLWDMGYTEVVDTTEITLNNSEDADVSFEWETEIGDAGSGEVMVETVDHNDTAPAQVLPSSGTDAPFLVDINEGTSTLDVEEGETVEFDVTVTNDGNETASQQIYLLDFDSDGLLDATDTGDLAPSESTNITLTWDTSIGDAPVDTPVTVASSADNDTAAVNVSALSGTDSQFDITIDEAASDDQTVAGSPLNVTAEITNNGADADEQNIVLWDYGKDSVTDVQSLTLGSGESQSVTLTWNTGDDAWQDSPGDVTVESNDDQDTTNVEVTEPGAGETNLTILDIDPAPATAGNTLTAEVEIANNGSAAAVDEWLSAELNEQSSDFTVDGQYDQIDVPAGGTKNVTVSLDTTETTIGDYDLTVETDDDSQTEVVTIDDPTTNFDIDIVNANDPIEAGEQLTVNAEVTNNNPGTGSDKVTVVLNDTRTGTNVDMIFDVEVDRGDSELVTFTWETAFGDGDDDNPVEIWAEIANTDVYDAENVVINETTSDVDGPSMGMPGNPLDIDLEEIEIDT